MADVVKFGGDAKEYFDVMAQMRGSLTDFGNHAGRSAGKFDESFLESARRVRRNMRELTQDIVSGNATAQSSFLRLSEIFRIGLPVGIGVAVGAGLAEAVTKIGEEALKTETTVRKLDSSALMSGRTEGVDAIKSKLQQIGPALEEIEKKQFSLRKAGLISGFTRGAFDLAEFAVTDENPETKRNEQIARLKQDARRLTDQYGESLHATNEIELASLALGEKKTALKKEELEHQRRIAEIGSLTLPGVDNSKAVKDEQDRHQIAKTAIGLEADARERAVRHAKVLADIEAQALPKRDESLKKLQEEVDFRRREVTHAQHRGPEAREEASTRLLQSQAQLTRFQVERQFADEQSLNAAKAQTTQIALQSAGEDDLATLAGIAANAEIARAQALFDGRNDLAEQVKKQKELLLLQERAKEILKSPEEKSADRERQFKLQNAFGQASSEEKDKLEAKERKYQHDRGFQSRFHPDQVPPSERKEHEERLNRIDELRKSISPRSAHDSQNDLGRHPSDAFQRLKGNRGSEEFDKSFHPLRDQAESDRADKGATKDAAGDKAPDLAGKIDALIGAVNAHRQLDEQVWK